MAQFSQSALHNHDSHQLTYHGLASLNLVLWYDALTTVL